MLVPKNFSAGATRICKNQAKDVIIEKPTVLSIDHINYKSKYTLLRDCESSYRADGVLLYILLVTRWMGAEAQEFYRIEFQQ